MKQVLIDSSDQDFFLALDIDGDYSAYTCPTHDDYQKKIFNKILNTLKKKIDLMSLQKIGIIRGPGSFSSIRIGLMFVKTLSIFSQAKVMAFEKIDLLLAKFKKKKASVLYIIYSDPNHHFLYLIKNNVIQKRMLLNFNEVKNICDDSHWIDLKKVYFSPIEISQIEVIKKKKLGINLIGYNSHKTFFNQNCFLWLESLSCLKKQNFIYFFKNFFSKENYLISPEELSPFYLNRLNYNLFK